MKTITKINKVTLAILIAIASQYFVNIANSEEQLDVSKDFHSTYLGLNQ